MEQAWVTAQSRLRATINNIQYCSWIEPLNFNYVDEENNEIHLMWPESKGTLNFVDKHYNRLIEETINSCISSPKHYSIVIEPGGGAFCVDETYDWKKPAGPDIVLDRIVGDYMPKVEPGDNKSKEYLDLKATLMSEELSMVEDNSITTVSVRLDGNKSDIVTELRLDRRTFVKGHFRRGDRIRIITEKTTKGGPSRYFPVIIADSNFKDFFGGSLDNLRLFLLADRGIQELIVDQRSIALDNESPSETPCCIDTIEKAKAYYSLVKESFTQNQRTVIEGWIDGVDKDSERKLKMFLNISPVYHSKNAVTSSQELYDRLDRAVTGLDVPKKEIVKSFAVSKRTRFAGTIICLKGPSGTGKTAFALALSEALDKPLQFIPCSELTYGVDATGDRNVFLGADVGCIIKSFFKARSSDCILVFDEFDKIPGTNTRSLSREGNPYNALHEFFSERVVRDKYLGIELYCPRTIIICTCNSINNIPTTIRNRFDSIIRLPAYSNDQIIQIAKEHTIPKMERVYNIPKGIIRFTEAGLREILTYIDDFGMRRTEHHIDSIYRQIITDWGGREYNVVVTSDMVDHILKDSVDMDDIRVIFRQNIELYPEKQREKIIYLEEQLDRQDLTDDKRQIVEKQLEYFVRLRPDKTPFTFDADRFFRETGKQIRGRIREKQRHAAIFNDMAVRKSNDRKGVIFIGPPGSGKTALIKKAAEAADMKYKKINLNGVSDTEFLYGQKPTVCNADAGIFVREAAREMSLRIMIHLDDLDYASFSVQASLLSLIEGTLEDNYLEGFPIDISSAVFIATANDISRIIPALLSRFAIVDVSPYSYVEQQEILRSHLIPEAIEGYTKEIVFLPDAEDTLMKYACKGGVRELKASVQAVVSGAYLAKSDMDRVIIYKQDVFDTLGPSKDERVLGFV